MIDFLLSDAVEWALGYTGEKFHALLADTPYALKFMNKKWDDDVAFRVETWKAFAKVLHDGAFGFAFASSRGWHRLAVAIEDAGLIIHPSMFGWAFGSGFPKATRVDTQIDKAEGVDRAEVGFAPNTKGRLSSVHQESQSLGAGWSGKQTAPATPLAQAFAGHRYGLQALKPALEPIIVFQKPYAGRPIDCITATGAGVLNVDGGRIGMVDGDKKSEGGRIAPSEHDFSNDIYALGLKAHATQTPQGRWPANFYLGDAEAARRLDAQSGERPSSGRHGESGSGVLTDNSKEAGWGMKSKRGDTYFDNGGASRFFLNVAEQIDDADPVRYCAKASRRERDAGLDGMPLKLSGSMTGKEYRPDRPTNHPMRHNTHPTIKPLALTRYLATLLLPPAEYAPRRLFVPFAGVGSEAIGASQAGWEFVQGVEITEEYLPIAQARAEYWTQKEAQQQMVMPLMEDVFA